MFDLLEQELGLKSFERDDSERADLLHQLRQALLERYDLVLVESQGGQGLDAFVMTQLIDQLVINARPTESPQTLKAFQATASWFFRSQKLSKRACSGALVVLHLSEYSHRDTFEGTKWIQKQLLHPDYSQTSPEISPWILLRNQMWKDPKDWKLTRIFEPLAQRLLNPRSTALYLPPEVQALEKMLDSQAPSDHRELMAGALEGLEFTSFIRALDSWLSHGDLERRTDKAGLKHLSDVLKHHRVKLFNELGGKS